MAVEGDTGKKRAVFLDKDGTLIENLPYNVDPAKIALEKHSVRGLRRLSEAGFCLVVVSNQSGVARGYFKEAALETVKARLNTLLEQKAGASLDGFYYCSHHPEGKLPEYAIECECRKPKPGMLLQAAKEMDIDLSQSWMIGDILDDIEAGKRAGCRSILLDNGHETIWLRGPFRTPDYVAANLDEAAEIILRQPEGGKTSEPPATFTITY